MDRVTPGSAGDNRRITLHQQVFDALRERILAGDYTPHQQLPSESCLMRDFGVSRVTVRQALKDLGNEGLIYSQQGKGSFVSAPRATYNLSALLGFHEAMQGKPFVATSRVLATRVLPASRPVAQALNLRKTDPVLEVRRVRCLNARPVSVEVSYFPGDIGERFRGEDLSEDIFPMLERRGVGLGRSRLWIEARPCPPDIAADLELAPGLPILQLTRLTFSALERPVDYEHLYCRGDAYQYKVELRRHPY